MIVQKIMAYESGELTDAETIYFFAELLQTKMINQLQGHYGRTAHRLIGLGVLTASGDIDEMRAIELGVDM